MKYLNYLLRFRWVILAVILIVLAAGAGRVQHALLPNNDIAIWFEPEDKELRRYREYQQVFGNDRIITISFLDSTGILTSRNLQQIDTTVSRLLAHPDVLKVDAVTNARDFIRRQHAGVTRIQFETWFENNPTFAITDSLRQAVSGSPLISGRFINVTGKAGLIAVRIKPDNELIHPLSQILPFIDSLSSRHLQRQVYLNGIDVIVDELNKQTEKDLTLYCGLAFLIMIVVAAIIVRDAAGTMMVVGSAVLSLMLTLLFYGSADNHLNVFTVMTPPLVIVLSIINCLHVMSVRNQLPHDLTPTDATVATVNDLVKPFSFAFVTTLTGSMALLTSDMHIIREFGMFASVGAFFSYLMPLVLAMVLLPYSKSGAKDKRGLIAKTVHSVCNSVLNHRWSYAVALVFAVVVGVYGAFRVKSDMFVINYFQAEHRVQQTHRFMEQHWKNYFPFEFLLSSQDNESLFSPTATASINRFDAKIQLESAVGVTFSHVTLMRRYAEVAFNRSFDEVVRNPLSSGKFTRDFTRILEKEAPEIISMNPPMARYMLTGRSGSNRQLEDDLAVIREIGRSTLAPGLDLELTGYQALFVRAMNSAFTTIRNSLLSALLTIFVLMFVFLRSWRLAIIALAPNVFPIIILFGYMGIRGIDLDLATCTVTALFLGIAVDDTIHIMHRFRNAWKSGQQTNACIFQAYRQTGRVFIMTSTVLLLGFLLMLPANLRTISLFGELAIVSTLSAFVGDLIIVPLLLQLLPPLKRV